MIIEIHCQHVDEVLFTAWEIPEYIWINKKEFIISLFYKYFKKYSVHYSEINWQENTIFNIITESTQFYHLEKLFNKYFNTIKVVNVVH